MSNKDTLRVRWSKRLRDIVFYWPKQRCDGRLLNNVICGKRISFNNTIEPSFIEELEKRGYDLTTMKFSIKLKSQPQVGTTEKEAL